MFETIAEKYPFIDKKTHRGVHRKYVFARRRLNIVSENVNPENETIDFDNAENLDFGDLNIEVNETEDEDVENVEVDIDIDTTGEIL